MCIPMMDQLQETERTSVGIHQCLERPGNKPRTSIQIDGQQGMLSGHARDCRSPARATIPVADIVTSLLTQDEPS